MSWIFITDMVGNFTDIQMAVEKQFFCLFHFKIIPESKYGCPENFFKAFL